VFSALHVPPPPGPESAITSTGPPVARTFFSLPAGKERDPVSVGRPEWRAGALGPWQNRSGEHVDWPYDQPALTPFVNGNERKPTAVARERHRRTPRRRRVQVHLLRQRHGEAEEARELVTREGIRRRLWGNDVFVDVDQGINTAINEIRQALSDDPNQPIFLQTVVGKGYRFVGPVKRITDDALMPRAPSAPSSTECAVVWEGRSIPLADGVNIIGRDSEATVLIDSSTVSRKHAQIVVSGSVATIEDLGSKNATHVNGQRLEGSMRLADYDVIQIGPATLIFRFSSPTGSTLTAGVR
jgi:hypothetical protein